jgi:hypothetical protein
VIDAALTPWSVNNYTHDHLDQTRRKLASINPSGAVAFAANAAIYVPFFLPFDYSARFVFWVNGGAVGNASLAIYDPDEALLFGTGSVAQVGLSTPQFASVGASPLELAAGLYHLRFVTSATQIYGSSWTDEGLIALGCRYDADGGLAAPPDMSGAVDTPPSTVSNPLIGLSRVAAPATYF